MAMKKYQDFEQQAKGEMTEACEKAAVSRVKVRYEELAKARAALEIMQRQYDDLMETDVKAGQDDCPCTGDCEY